MLNELLLDISFITGYFFTLFVSIYFYRMADLGLFKPSIPMVFFYAYLVFSFLGLPLLYFELDPIHWIEPRLAFRVLIYSGVTLVLVTFGFVYAKYIIRLRKKTKERKKTVFSIPLIWLLVLLCICFVALVLYAQRLPSIPLQELLQGESSQQLYALRLNSSIENHWRYAIFFEELLPFLSYVLVASFVMTRKKIFLFWMLIAIAFCTISLTFNLEKAPIFWYFLSMIFLIFLVRGKKIPWKTSVIILIVFIGLTVSVSATLKGRPWLSSFRGPTTRILSGQLSSAALYLEIFPERHDFLYGNSIPNPGGILPIGGISVAKLVASIIRSPGSSPAPFWAEMYANFGNYGMISGFIIGIIMFVIHQWVNDLEDNPLNFSLIIYLAFELRRIALTSALQYLFPLQIIFILIVWYFLRGVQKHDFLRGFLGIQTISRARN